MNETTIINIAATLLNIFNGIVCYKKFKISNRKIFLFGILLSAVGVAFGYIGILFSDSSTPKIVESRKEETDT